MSGMYEVLAPTLSIHASCCYVAGDYPEWCEHKYVCIFIASV